MDEGEGEGEEAERERRARRRARRAPPVSRRMVGGSEEGPCVCGVRAGSPPSGLRGRRKE